VNCRSSLSLPSRSPPTAFLFSSLEIGSTIGEAKEALLGVEKWAKPEKPEFSFNFYAMRPVIYKVPKGVVLIISPFNYPIWLSLGPLVRFFCEMIRHLSNPIIQKAGAIAAGNAVVVKPSEQTPAVSALIAELVPKYLDPQLIRVVNGAIPESTKASNVYLYPYCIVF
jgi:aldehyde dehydrogenase (NAD+)